MGTIVASDYANKKAHINDVSLRLFGTEVMPSPDF